MARRAATIVVCMLVIGGSLYCVLRPPYRRPTINPADYRRPWVCDACRHTFLELPSPATLPCPKCGQPKGVQSIIYVCGTCGHEFEAYRMKDYYSAAVSTDEDGQPVLPMAYYKKPGGSWTTAFDEVRPTACPKCGNPDAATLAEKRFGPEDTR